MLWVRQCVYAAYVIAGIETYVQANRIPQIAATTEQNAVARYQSSPLPTAAPDIPDVLFERQNLNQLQTCGYILGTVGWYCLGNYSCFWGQDSAAGCCTATEGCILPTTCLPYSSSAEAATKGAATIYCEDAGKPDCAVFTYAGADYHGSSFLFCNTASTTQPIYFSYNATANYTPTPITSSSSSSSTSSSTTTSPIPSTTTTPPPTPTPTPPPSSTDVGAIVGGVVGGVAALALIGLLAFFLFRKRKKPSSPQEAGGLMPDGRNDYYRSSVVSPQMSSTTGTWSPPPNGQQQPYYAPGYSYMGQQMDPQMQNQTRNWSDAQEMPAVKQENPAQELAAVRSTSNAHELPGGP